MKNHINIGSRHAELEEYLAEEEEEDLEMDVLDYWRRCEVRWPNLAKMVSSSTCLRTARVVSRRRARLLCGGADALRFAQVPQRPLARALSLLGVQHPVGGCAQGDG